MIVMSEPGTSMAPVVGAGATERDVAAGNDGGEPGAAEGAADGDVKASDFGPRGPVEPRAREAVCTNEVDEADGDVPDISCPTGAEGVAAASPSSVSAGFAALCDAASTPSLTAGGASAVPLGASCAFTVTLALSASAPFEVLKETSTIAPTQSASPPAITPTMTGMFVLGRPGT